MVAPLDPIMGAKALLPPRPVPGPVTINAGRDHGVKVALTGPGAPPSEERLEGVGGRALLPLPDGVGRAEAIGRSRKARAAGPALRGRRPHRPDLGSPPDLLREPR